MFKIALILPQLTVGGAEQVVLDLATYLKNNGQDVEVLCTGKMETMLPRFLNRNIKVHKFNFDRQNKKSFSRFIQYLKDCKTVLEYFQKSKFDIVHVHLNGPDNYCIPLAKKAKVKGIFYTLHNTYKELEGNSFYQKIVRAYKRNIYKQCDKIFAVDKKVEDWAIKQQLISPKKIKTILNGIDFSRVNCSEKKEEIRKELGFSEKEIIVINVGRLSKQKNQKSLIRAMDIVRNKTDKPVKLLIVGEGPLEEVLINEIKKLGLEDIVKMMGLRNDVPRLLKASDLFIFPSLWEGLPIALLEAISVGLPIAVSKIDAHINLFSEGISGYMIDGHDPEPIAKAILCFLENRVKCEALAKKSQRVVYNKYSLEAMGERYLEVYVKILKEKEGVK